MSGVREEIAFMKNNDRISSVTYFEDVNIHEYIHQCSAIADSRNFRLLKDRWKERFDVEFVCYDIKKIGDEATITNNDKFGFSLYMMTSDLNNIKKKIDNIWIPDKRCPCYVNIGDGFYYILAPFDYVSGSPDEDITLKLSKPQKSLSSFW